MKIEPKDLIVGALYWYYEYQGSGSPASRTLVKMLGHSYPATLQNVFTGETIQALPSYGYFETVHPDWLDVNIESAQEELVRLARKLEILKGLK